MDYDRHIVTSINWECEIKFSAILWQTGLVLQEVPQKTNKYYFCPTSSSLAIIKLSILILKKSGESESTFSRLNMQWKFLLQNIFRYKFGSISLQILCSGWRILDFFWTVFIHYIYM